ncbi:MAG: helix-turn-helix domain-containing protein [Verrucomicrobiota bacterium]
MLCRKVVPEGFRLTGQKTILTQEQREEVLRRLATGETQASIAKDFNVTRAAISLLKQRTANPERYTQKYDLKKRLSAGEITTFKQTLDQTLPQDHGLEFVGHALPKFWTMERGYALADKLFGKDPAVRVMKECMGNHLVRRPDGPLAPPEPPGPRDIRRLPPDLAADKSFVKYYMSPIALQIEQREYELALEHYHQQLAKQQPRETANTPDDILPPELDDEEWDDDWAAQSIKTSHPGLSSQPPPPGQRIGKHAKSKGSPFTKTKRKKKKR